MSEEQLESTHILRRGLQMSGRAIIEFALSHAIHHSGQAAAYLGAKGIKVPPFQPLFRYYAYSGPNRPLIPIESGHLFRGKPAGDSGAK